MSFARKLGRQVAQARAAVRPTYDPGFHTEKERRARAAVGDAVVDASLAEAPKRVTPAAVKAARDIAPRILPASWAVDQEGEDGFLYRCADGRTVICSVGLEDDGALWIHMSVSRPDRLPSYDDLCECKTIFIGAEREAYQVFARRSRHVNLNPNVLHLWARYEDEALPDFTHGRPIL